MKHVALAYPGGLRGNISLHHLVKVKGFRVTSFTGNLGQPEYLEPLAEEAVERGAVAANLADLRERYLRKFVFPCLRADAVYEHGYHLFGALAEPLILQELVEVAREEGCRAIALCTRGRRNSRLRMVKILRTIAPDLELILPLEDLELHTLDAQLKYVRSHGINVPSERDLHYDIEKNLWGNSLRFQDSDGGWSDAPADTYLLVRHPSATPDRETVIEVGFEEGLPVSVDGKRLEPVPLVERLNRIGGGCGVGRVDLIESSVTGDKTREIYEAPAATILHAAHRALEALTLERDVLHFKEALSSKYADLVFEGKWFLGVREGLDAFFRRIQGSVTGVVRMMLYKGSLNVLGRKSPYSLFSS